MAIRSLSLPACLAVLALGLTFAGCGDEPAELTRAEAVSVKLGASPEQVKERLGKPEKDEPYSKCLIYVAEGIKRKARGSRKSRRRREKGDDRARWQFCFDSKGERLRSIALDGDWVR